MKKYFFWLFNIFNISFIKDKTIEAKKLLDKKWCDNVKNGSIKIKHSDKKSFVDLSDDEKKYIKNTFNCPDCITGNLMEGPSGGLCTNFICKNCGSKFNIGMTVDLSPTGFKAAYSSKGELHFLVAERI